MRASSILVLMVQDSTNRRFGAFLVHSLYRTAIHAGLIREGEYLALDDDLAAFLFGIRSPGQGDLKEVRDVLGYQLRYPPLGWAIEPWDPARARMPRRPGASGSPWQHAPTPTTIMFRPRPRPEST